MKAINKSTGNVHSVCPVLSGYQVCVVAGEDIRTTDIKNIKVFLDSQFSEMFEIIKYR